MFCPKCGQADQSPESYCRQCGTFLPDLSKPTKKENTPEEHIKVNTVLSLMTVVVCFTLAILLYSLLGFRPETPVMIYVTAGLLIAMGAWHIQSFIRIRKLKRQWAIRNPKVAVDEVPLITMPASRGALGQADLKNNVPMSVTEQTTQQLSEKKIRSS